MKKENKIVNEVAKEANKELSIAKCKIRCLTVLIVLFAVVGACIAFYSIYSLKELFYNLDCEIITIEQEIDAVDGGNATAIIGNFNEVNEDGEN